MPSHAFSWKKAMLRQQKKLDRIIKNAERKGRGTIVMNAKSQKLKLKKMVEELG